MIYREDSKNWKVAAGRDKKLTLIYHEMLVDNWYFSFKNKNTGRFIDISNGLIDMLLSKQSFLFMKKIVQFYITEIEPNFNIDAVLTKTQQELYGLTDLKTNSKIN